MRLLAIYVAISALLAISFMFYIRDITSVLVLEISKREICRGVCAYVCTKNRDISYDYDMRNEIFLAFVAY